MSLKDKLFITLTPFQNSISFTPLKHSSIFCLLHSIFNNYFKQMQKQTFEHILSQTYNASLFLFAYFFVNAHVLSKSFHLINSSFSQASNQIGFNTGQKNKKNFDEGCTEKMKCMVMFQYSTCDMHFWHRKIYGTLSKFFLKILTKCFLTHLHVKSANTALMRDF